MRLKTILEKQYCEVCGDEIVERHNAKKYCRPCAEQVYRESLRVHDINPDPWRHQREKVMQMKPPICCGQAMERISHSQTFECLLCQKILFIEMRFRDYENEKDTF